MLFTFLIFILLNTVNAYSNQSSIIFVNMQSECDHDCILKQFWYDTFSTNTIFVQSSFNKFSFNLSRIMIVDIGNYIVPSDYNFCWYSESKPPYPPVKNITEFLFDAFALTRQQIDPFSFDFQMLLVPSNNIVCDMFANTYTESCPNTNNRLCMSIVNRFHSASFARAIGFNLGISYAHDASYLDFDRTSATGGITSPPDLSIPTNFTDVTNLTFFNVHQRYLLGWIPETNILIDPPFGSYINVSAASSVPGTDPLIILFNDIFLYSPDYVDFIRQNAPNWKPNWKVSLSYRTNLSIDSNLNTSYQYHIHVLLWNPPTLRPTLGYTHFIDQFGDNITYSYPPAGYNICFMTIAKTCTYATIYFGPCNTTEHFSNIVTDKTCNTISQIPSASTTRTKSATMTHTGTKSVTRTYTKTKSATRSHTRTKSATRTHTRTKSVTRTHTRTKSATRP